MNRKVHMACNQRVSVPRAYFGAALPLGFLLLLPVEAHAQTAGAEGDATRAQAGGVEEVVVTALKRTTRLQDVPSTVVVTSGDAVQRAGVTRADELGQIVPGLQLQAPSPGLLTASVRGLSSSPSNNSFEQTVGLFVDGIFAGHARDYTAALFDIDSVELLKGTQAAVLGKNTSVGAIGLNTRKPQADFGYDLSYQHEFKLGSDIISGGVNIPLSDTLSVRLAGTYSDRDGWVHYRQKGGDYPQTQIAGARASARWRPNDNIDWTFSTQFTSLEVDGQALFLGGDTLGRAQATAAIYGVPNSVPIFNSSDATPRQGFVFDGKTSPDPYDDATAERHTSILNYYLGDHTITVVSGYSSYNDHYILNAGGMPNNPFLRAQSEFNESYSQELRLTSPLGTRFDYIAGLYYYNDTWGVLQLSDLLPAVGFTGDGSEANYYKQKIESLSGFAQFTYGMTDTLSFTGGARYDNQKKSAFFNREILRAGGITRNLPPYPPTTQSMSDDAITYSAQLKYDVRPNSILYAGYFTGFKAGGFQSVPTNPATAGYKPETSKTVELGGKFGLGSTGGHINVALFHTKLDNFQFAFNTGIVFLVRSDFIRSQGMDLDVVVPLGDHFTLSQSVTYADVQKTRKVTGANNSLPWAPQWSGISSATFKHPLTNNFDIGVDLAVQFRSKEFLNDARSFVRQYSGGYAKVNFKASVEDKAKGVEVALVGKNLTNERVINYAVPMQTAGAYYAVSDPPRTIAISVNIRR